MTRLGPLDLSVATASSHGHARHFEPDGPLVCLTREVCQAARTAIHRLGLWADHDFLEDCVPREPRPS